MVTMTNFFDLYDILVNEVSGSFWIFIFLSSICIAFAGAYFRMTNETTILMLIFWFFLMGIWSPAMLIIAVFASAGFIAWQYNTWVKGG